MGVAYILTNELMPDIVKLGFSERSIQERMKELSRAPGVPVPFDCFYAIEISQPKELEAALMSAFGKWRVNPKREFFEIDPEQPAAILLEFVRRGLAKDVTPGGDVTETKEEEAALEAARARRKNFKYVMAGVPDRAELTSVFDDAVTATAVYPNRVLFESAETSLSDAAQQVARRLGVGWKAIQGPAYWRYQGAKLSDLRDQLEAA